MNGLLYKDFRQNRIAVLFAVILPMFFLLFPAFMPTADDSAYSVKAAFTEYSESGIVLKALFLLIGFLIFDMLTLSFLTADEVKKWAYFSASTPKGIKGQVFTKYASIFITTALNLILLSITSVLLNKAIESITGLEAQSMIKMLTYFSCAEIILKAIDLPFCIRFGSKKGSAIKTAMFMGAFVILMICLLFAPIPLDNDEFFDNMFEFLSDLFSGKYSDQLKLLKSVFPAAAIVSYVLSFMISCKLYLKGVETYDK